MVRLTSSFLQLYLNEFCWKFNRRFFKDSCDPKYDLFDRLVKIAAIYTSDIKWRDYYLPDDEIVLRFVSTFITTRSFFMPKGCDKQERYTRHFWYFCSGKRKDNLWLDKNSRVFILIFLGMLTAFGPFVTDMYLPTFPEMADFFHTSSSMVPTGLDRQHDRPGGGAIVLRTAERQVREDARC